MIKSIRQAGTDFWAFIKNPKEELDLVHSDGFKARRLFSILALELPIMVLLVALLALVESTGLLDMGSHGMTDFLKFNSAWIVIVFGVLIVPIVEEIIFRSYLRLRYNFPLRILMFFSSVFGEQNKQKFQLLIERKWEKYFKAVFYFSAVLFAAVHLSNFKYSHMLLLLSPIVVMPQFLLGLFIGYLRVKYGLMWGFYLHAVHNMIFLGMALLFMSEPGPIVDIANEQFKLKIEEVSPSFHPSQSSTLTSDSISFENIRFTSLLGYLLDVEQKQIVLDAKDDTNWLLNVSFKSYDNSILNKGVILEELQNAYSFTIRKSEVLQEVWMLQIADTSLLFQYQIDSANSSVVGVYRKELKLENVPLNKLAETLNSSFEEYILTDIDLNQKFNFQIQRTDFAELQNILKNDYGLSLNEKKDDIKQIKVLYTPKN